MNVIGLMSGTSLDGLDIAYCRFKEVGGKWSHSIVKANTIVYGKEWRGKLTGAIQLSAEQYEALHTEFGRYMGKCVNDFIRKNRITGVDLISSHGHTVFHQPDKGFTSQLGSAAALAAITGLPVACDFRSKDVALGGQGAPLVPVGDELLFKGYDACLNIGGIANVSFHRNKKRLAFDICVSNMALNYLAEKKGLPYDKGGKLAASGNVHWNLMKKLNAHPFYKGYTSKSLGREWVEKNVLRVIDKEKISLEDKLATVAEHAALQMARVLNHFKVKDVLITGGGAYNQDLIARLAAYADCSIQIPDDNTIQYKEALIFAFLGVLRVRGEVNCFGAVTGATRDSVGGALYL